MLQRSLLPDPAYRINPRARTRTEPVHDYLPVHGTGTSTIEIPQARSGLPRSSRSELAIITVP